MESLAPSNPEAMSEHVGFTQAYENFRNDLAANGNTADAITQSLAQFAVPMLGWSKLLGMTKLLSVPSLAAESATVSTAFDPHASRTADLLAAGKQVEGRLGDALNTIAPDGSLVNAYINYMTDRSDEGEAEGRFKNVLDQLLLSASGAALIKSGALAMKAGRNLPAYVPRRAN
jgi:hypothetical protein